MNKPRNNQKSYNKIILNKLSFTMSRLISSLVAVVLLLQSTPTQAQEEVVPPELTVQTGETTSPLQCFDWYILGSVQADLQPTLAQTIPGVALYFQGEIVNNNPYPLVEGTLYVKIFKQDDGNPVVDQFVIAKNITLPANGTQDTSFEWLVPANAEGGEYYAAYFFVTSKRYNLMGLSFTDNVVGNTALFTITSDNQPVAKLNKIDTTLNGQTHTYTGFPLHFNTEESVTVTTTITNPTAEAKTMPLQWNQYAWDSLNPDNRRFTKTELVTLAPNETKEVSYNVASQRESVVYITAITQDNEAKSILNIRYIQDGVQETRINFPSITKFPLVAGEEQTLFACAHSTNEPVVPGNTLTLTLTDKAGNQIHQYQYEGDITGAMSGFGDTFTPAKNYNYALLTATLKRGDVTIDEVQIEYDCKTIDPNSCLPEEVAASTFFDKIFSNPLFLLGGALTLLLLLFLVWSVHRRHHTGPAITKIKMTTLTSLLFFLLLVPALFFATGVDKAEAKSVTWTGNITLSPYPNYYLNTSINYSSTLRDNTTNNPIADGSTVAVGSVISLKNDGFNNTSIDWTPQGSSGPYMYPSFGIVDANQIRQGLYSSTLNKPASVCVGAHIALSSSGSSICVGSSFYGSGGGDPGGSCGYNNTYYHFTPMVVVRPSVSVSKTGGTASVSCSGDTCTVNSAGTLVLTATYSSTNLRTYAYRTDIYGACAPTNYGPEYSDTTVPKQTISYNLNAVVLNNPPTAPTINGSTNGTFNGIVNTDYYFDFRATDPDDGDQITYSIDLDNNGTVDTGSPYGTPVNSGTTQNIHVGKWATPGTYTIKARTNDTKGGMSGWTSHTVVIAAAPAPTATLTINGSGAPISVVSGSNLALSWSSTNAASCTLYGANLPGGGGTVAVSGNTSATAYTSDSYVLSCNGANDSVQVTVTPAPINGSCSASLNTCGAGVFADTTDSATNYLWNCNGQNGGTNASCSMPKPPPPVNGSCGIRNTSYTYDITTWPGGSSYCAAGTQSASPAFPAQSNSVIWQCYGQNGGTDSPQCTASRAAAPGCGTASGGTYTSQPSTNLCSTGSASWSDTTGTDGAYNWSCGGASCAANFKPVPPTGMTATPQACGTNQLYLDWNDVSGATSYSVYYSNGTWVGNSTGSNYTFTGTAGQYYSFYVRANSSAGVQSTNSSVFSGTVPGACGKANLSNIIFKHISSSTTNPVTGNYDWVDITYNTKNTGVVGTGANPQYVMRFDRSSNGYDQTTSPATIGILSAGQTSANLTQRFTNVPFGSFTVEVTVDSQKQVDESNESDNVGAYTQTLAPSDPGLTIIVDRKQVRPDDTVAVTWSATATYPMNCSVKGPAGIDETDNSAPYSGSKPTGPITAKSTFTFSCTEPSTNTTWTTSADVETVGTLEEV